MRCLAVSFQEPTFNNPNFNLSCAVNGDLWVYDILFFWSNELSGLASMKRKFPIKIIYELYNLRIDNLSPQRIYHNLLQSSLKILCILKINLGEFQDYVMHLLYEMMYSSNH